MTFRPPSRRERCTLPRLSIVLLRKGESAHEKEELHVALLGIGNAVSLCGAECIDSDQTINLETRI